MDPKPFTSDDLLWDVTGQYLYAMTTGSAFVLQVMHPAIGTVVDQRSTYRSDPWGRAERSFASVQTWIYGGGTAVEEGYRLRAMHKDLRAVDSAGRRHSALAAEPWAWVPLTAYHALVTYSRYFRPGALTERQLELGYGEVLRMCRILQVPERMLPPTPADYWVYYEDMIERVLENHPTAHSVIAVAERTPPMPTLPAPVRRLWPLVGMPFGEFNRLVIVGTLPPSAREKLGLTWSRKEERLLRSVGAVVGRLNAALPERVAYMPIAREARRAARGAPRGEERLARALAERPL